MSVSPTIVVLHEQSGVLELIEAALRDCGPRVLGTLDASDGMSPANNHVASDLRASQTGLSVVVLDDEPMRLDEIADAVVAALPPRGECS
jgi:hypothetical protein